MYVKDDVKNNSGSINYNNLTYYYSIVNNIVRFYDKFGNESNQSLSDNLLIKLNNKNFTTYTLREIIKNNNYKFDKFSIVIDKTKTEKELQAIVNALKKHNAELIISNLKRNFLGNISTIKLEVNWYTSAAAFDYSKNFGTIKPLKIILDNRTQLAKVVSLSQIELNSEKTPNTQIQIDISKTSTDNDFIVYKKQFDDLGVNLIFKNVKRDKIGLINSIEVESTMKSILNQNKTIFMIGEGLPIKDFKIILDKDLNKVLIKFK